MYAAKTRVPSECPNCKNVKSVIAANHTITSAKFTIKMTTHENIRPYNFTSGCLCVNVSNVNKT